MPQLEIYLAEGLLAPATEGHGQKGPTPRAPDDDVLELDMT